MLVRVTTIVAGSVKNRQLIPMGIERVRASMAKHNFKRVSEFRYAFGDVEVLVVPNHMPAETDNWRRLWGKDERRAEYALK